MVSATHAPSPVIFLVPSEKVGSQLPSHPAPHRTQLFHSDHSHPSSPSTAHDGTPRSPSGSEPGRIQGSVPAWVTPSSSCITCFGSPKRHHLLGVNSLRFILLMIGHAIGFLYFTQTLFVIKKNHQRAKRQNVYSEVRELYLFRYIYMYIISIHIYSLFSIQCRVHIFRQHKEHGLSLRYLKRL